MIFEILIQNNASVRIYLKDRAPYHYQAQKLTHSIKWFLTPKEVSWELEPTFNGTTNYGPTKAKSLILCSPNSSLNPQ